MRVAPEREDAMTGDAVSRPRSPRGPRPRPRYGALMKIVRRVHMYLGLLLFPWILLFGISGMLFNHPEIGRDIERRHVSGEQISALTGFQPWDPDALARRVVAQLNAGSSSRYTLDEDTAGSFSGWPIFAAPRGDGGRHVVILRLDDGSASVADHAPEPEAPAPPFAGAAIDLPEHRMAAVQEQLKELLPRLGVDAKGPLRAHPKVAPELRFRVRDAEDRLWNVTYNLGTGRLDGRIEGAAGRPRLVQVLETLHKTHHFPVHGGMAWVWALFADITGLTLVVWALSGLVMWWQMKPTRVIGAAAVAAALALFAVVMSGTAEDVLFGNVEKDGP